MMENDVTSSPTLNYGQQPQAYVDQPYISQLASTSQNPDTQGVDTARFYRAPAAQYNQQQPAPNYGPPPAKSSKAAIWFIMIALFLMVMFAIGGIAFFTAVNKSRPVVQTTIDEVRQQVQEEIQRAQEEAQRAQEEAIRAQEEAARIARESGGVVDQPPPPPPPPGIVVTDLDKYKYPKSDIEQKASVLGNEILKMSTSDSTSAVRDFYQKLVGPPSFVNKDAVAGETYVFQVAGSPSIMITVSPNEDQPGKTQIAVFRTRFQIPKISQ